MTTRVIIIKIRAATWPTPGVVKPSLAFYLRGLFEIDRHDGTILRAGSAQAVLFHKTHFYNKTSRE